MWIVRYFVGCWWVDGNVCRVQALYYRCCVTTFELLMIVWCELIGLIVAELQRPDFTTDRRNEHTGGQLNSIAPMLLCDQWRLKYVNQSYRLCRGANNKIWVELIRPVYSLHCRTNPLHNSLMLLQQYLRKRDYLCNSWRFPALLIPIIITFESMFENKKHSSHF